MAPSNSSRRAGLRAHRQLRVAVVGRRTASRRPTPCPIVSHRNHSAVSSRAVGDRIHVREQRVAEGRVVGVHAIRQESLAGPHGGDGRFGGRPQRSARQVLQRHLAHPVAEFVASGRARLGARERRLRDARRNSAPILRRAPARRTRTRRGPSTVAVRVGALTPSCSSAWAARRSSRGCIRRAAGRLRRACCTSPLMQRRSGARARHQEECRRTGDRCAGAGPAREDREPARLP